MLNIFSIPSWYPNRSHPLSGIFTKEKSLFISESGKVKFWISCIDEYKLSPRKPLKSITEIFNYIKSRNYFIEKKLNPNYIELWSKSFVWSKRILNGNFGNLYKIRKEHLERVLSITNIDVIHAHVSYPAGYIAYLLSKKFNIPYIVTEHMGPFPFKTLMKGNKPIKEIELAINNAYIVVAVSEYQKREILSFGLKEPIVIPNFINEDDYSLSTNLKKTDKFTFLTVGFLVPQKGIDLLIKAIPKSGLCNVAEFRIVGDGPLFEKYKNLSIKMNVEKCIKFLGRISRDRVKREFTNCDCFVLPSRHESFGVVYIEALACGKPVIATKCGGPEDIVNDKVGLLIEKENIEELARALKYMYTNADKYNSEDIRKYFMENFSKKVNVPKYLNIYKEIANVRNNWNSK